VNRLVQQGKQAATIFKLVSNAGYRNQPGTIQALIDFYRAAKSAGNALQRLINRNIKNFPLPPTMGKSVKTLRIYFDFDATLKGNKLKTFKGFVIDVPPDATPQQIQQMAEDKALDVKSANYQIEVVHVKITSVYGVGSDNS